MELDIWAGEWGLPSVDCQCLTAMAYCKFSDVPIKFVKTRSLKALAGDLPTLRHGGVHYTKLTEIFDYLREQNWGTDHDLTVKQSADILAYVAMMDDKLLPGLLQVWWADSKNYLDLTRPWYAKAVPFPLSLYVPLAKRRAATSRLSGACPGDNLTETEQENIIYRRAKECLNALSAKLGEKEYFFGKVPSFLDAMAFGYLASLLKAPFINSVMQNHLRGCPNLCRLCNKILTKYFPLTPEETEALKKKEEQQKKQQADTSDFPNRRRNMWLAAAVGLTAMVGYAFLSGLIAIEITDENESKVTLENESPRPTLPDFAQFQSEENEEGNGESSN